MLTILISEAYFVVTNSNRGEFYAEGEPQDMSSGLYSSYIHSENPDYRKIKAKGGMLIDFDLDGDPDLYVTNDFGKNNLYINDKGHFRDVAGERGAEDLAAGMGVTCEDFDLDGDMDIYISNMFSSAGRRIVPQTNQFMSGENKNVHQHYERHARGNTILSNRGNGFFEDVTDASGAAIGGWAWGAKSVDFNNDGFADIYSPNGFVTNPDEDDL